MIKLAKKKTTKTHSTSRMFDDNKISARSYVFHTTRRLFVNSLAPKSLRRFNAMKIMIGQIICRLFGIVHFAFL